MAIDKDVCKAALDWRIDGEEETSGDSLSYIKQQKVEGYISVSTV